MQASGSHRVFALWFGFGALVAALVLPSSSSAGSKETVAEGAALFSSSGCPQCHGPEGMGTAKAPSLRDVPKQLTPEQTHTQIHDGGKQMPPFGEALTEEQIAALVDFLHAKDGWKLVPATASK